ncbi:hypothetical protein GCM10023194_05770 [Planotetraspora phitsanulokensis]|uniref:Uncharacterized protein n=1 Tax=Planotetraspora phitsanulokensis TaxID=575192 RepID=A0A8J3U5M9_9ACTN|nr:hypothetical protein [Planotetraspora phitsanulokensis]GII39073.1 hypothetical protein Pph01_40760 [Planotetraspora phitsanulokensis]
MLQTTILAFLAGALGANATPHFVKGITKEHYPTAFGSSPLINLIGGWILYVITALLVIRADMTSHPAPAFVAASLGVLLMGVFHAHVGAFGRKVPDADGSGDVIGL